ncbi:ankyrin repeat-containing domain protein [Xylariaceae sp. FL1651]|nr:ankyrin repeat-containing domain protein [Xylariaceae sp. FL1651]
MAEILGVTTGLIGAVDVIIRSSRSLTKFISDIKNAPKESAKVKLELENLEAIISAIQGYLESSKAKQQPLLESSTVGRAIKQCEDYVDNLRDTTVVDNPTASEKARWAFRSKNRCNEIIQELNRYTNLFHLALSLDGWELFFKSSTETTRALKRVSDDLQRVVDIIKPMESMKKDLEEWEDHLLAIREAIAFSSAVPIESDSIDKLERREKLLDSITKIKLEPKHSDIANRRHENTGRWIHSDDEFQKWLRGEGAKCLWIHGIPGCGKTVMLSAIVDHLKKKEKSHVMAVVPAYLTHQDPTLHNIETLFQAILRSSANNLYEKPDTLETLLKLQTLCLAPQERLPNLQECLDTLSHLAQAETSIVLCFDGVDELPDASQQQLLKALDSPSLLGVKILITSRSNLNLRSLTHSAILMSACETDLRLVLHTAIADIIEDIAADRTASSQLELEERIVTRVIERSKGMFLLAILRARQLRSAASVREILELVDSLPEELDAQYSMYLDRVKSQPRNKLALKAIKWVSCSYRPLQVPELLEALATRPGDSDLDPTGMTAVSRVIQAAGGLLVLDTHTNIIRLIHDSLRTYIQRNQAKILGEAHTSILESLSAYMNFQEFNSTEKRILSETWLDIELLKSKYRLLEYVCCYWNYHLHLAGTSALHFGKRIATRVSESSSLLRITTSTRLGSAVSSLTPFQISILWGNPALAARIIAESNMSSEHSTTPNLTALHIAARFDDIASAEICVQINSDLAQRDLSGMSPIHIAASYGSISVLIFILEAAKKLNRLESIRDLLDGQGRSPLHTALSGGHLSCVEKLLSYGANSNADNPSSGMTSMHLAILHCPSAIRALQASGAKASGLSKNGRLALHYACSVGDICNSLRPLLTDLDPNRQDREGATPMHVLSSCGKSISGAMEWLLQLGANPNLQDQHGFSPLHLALRFKDYAAAEVLLKYGASAALESVDGTLPVLIAASHGDCPTELFGRLLEGQEHSENVEPLLHRAVRRQKANEVNSLIQSGVDVNGVNSNGETPLHIAVLLAPGSARHMTTTQQRSNIISLLVHNSANIHALSHAGFTPLHIAVIRDSLPILRQLLNLCSGLHESLYLPTGVPLFSFAVLHSSPDCFDKLLQASRNEVYDAILFHLLEVIKALLNDYHNNKNPDQDLIHRMRSYIICLGLNVNTASRPDLSFSRTHLQECSFKDFHHMPCAEFHSLCCKARILASFQGSDGTYLAARPDSDPDIEHWQSICRANVGRDHFQDTIRSTQNTSVKDAFRTTCLEDANDLASALNWPENTNAELDLINSTEISDHFWEDSIAFLSSTDVSNLASTLSTGRISASVVTGYRQLSLVTAAQKLSPSNLRGLSVTGVTISKKKLNVYNSVRSRLLDSISERVLGSRRHHQKKLERRQSVHLLQA